MIKKASWDMTPNCVFSPSSFTSRRYTHVRWHVFCILSYKVFKLKCLSSRPAFEVSDTRSNTHASSWILDYFPERKYLAIHRLFKLVVYSVEDYQSKLRQRVTVEGITQIFLSGQKVSFMSTNNCECLMFSLCNKSSLSIELKKIAAMWRGYEIESVFDVQWFDYLRANIKWLK